MSSVTADDGCEIAYHEREGGQGKPVVLLVHALAMSTSMWDGVCLSLAGEARLIAVDCRGHGVSGKPEGPYDTTRFAKDFAAVLDACKVDKAIVVGCSMGGTAAQRFAALYPARTAGLVLLDTTAWYGATAPRDWEARASKAEDEGMASLIEFQLERWFSDAFKAAQPAMVEKTVDVFLKNDAEAYGATCRMLGVADERAAIAKFNGPTVVALGEHDQATPLAMAKDLVSRIKGAQLHVIPGAKHFTPIEAPEEVASCIRKLLA